MSTKPTIELQNIFASLDKSFCNSLSRDKRRVLEAVKSCRTAHLGTHFTTCSNCNYQEFSYNSCRNRHCPKCQGAATARWVESREEELLPVPYAHTVFTLPQELRMLCYQNKQIIYKIFFEVVSETLNTVAANPKFLGAKLTFFCVLHTWNQQLQYHPHLHIVSPKGGLSLDNTKWVPCRTNFFLPVRALSKLFRAKMLSAISKAFSKKQFSFYGSLKHLDTPKEFKKLLFSSTKSNWVVYSKKPFGGPNQVIKYLSAYVQRVAISNYRLRSFDKFNVTFSYRDSKHKNKKRLSTVSTKEFTRRFLMHILPRQFVRIRHYGLFSTATKKLYLPLIKTLLLKDSTTQPNKSTLTTCPQCKEGKLNHLLIIPHRRSFTPLQLFTFTPITQFNNSTNLFITDQ